jgi:hypothetical protein
MESAGVAEENNKRRNSLPHVRLRHAGDAGTVSGVRTGANSSHEREAILKK